LLNLQHRSTSLLEGLCCIPALLLAGPIRRFKLGRQLLLDALQVNTLEA
jgi:hypothetical protein